MANTKISALADGDPIQLTDAIPIARAGANFRVTTGTLVRGPSSATDNAIARFDVTTGKLLQNSLVTVDDVGDLFAGNGLVGTPTYSWTSDPDTGIYHHTDADTIAIAAGGANRAFIASGYQQYNGNVFYANNAGSVVNFFITDTGNAFRAGSDKFILWTATADPQSGTADTWLSRHGAAVLQMGLDDTTGLPQKLKGPESTGSGIAGGAFTLTGGDGTVGNANGGDVVLDGGGKAGTGSVGGVSIGGGVTGTNLKLDRTITAGGTTGAQTINKISGTVNIAASGTSVVVTNSLVSTSSIIHVMLRTNDATARIISVVAAAGSFTINIAAATAEVSLGFLVTN